MAQDDKLEKQAPDLSDVKHVIGRVAAGTPAPYWPPCQSPRQFESTLEFALRQLREQTGQ